MSNKQKKAWAIFTSVFDRLTADWLMHAFIIVSFGKSSLRELSDQELNELCEWGIKITGGGK